MHRGALAVTAAALVCLAWGGVAHAAGFQIDLHDARGTGRSFADTAGVDNASAGYFNPAAMSELEGHEIRLGAHWLQKPTDYDPDPGEGEDEEMRRNDFLIPNFHSTFDISENIDAGFSFFVPFALETKWPGDFAGRYLALENRVQWLFFNPNVSLQVPEVPGLSLGLGIQVTYGEVFLSRAIDFRNFGEPDGKLEVEGDSDVVVGYNAALRYSLLGDRVVLGASWRHVPDDYEIDGEAEFKNVPAFTGLPAETDAETEITLPPWLQVGVQAELVPQTFWVEFDYKWTGWTTLDEIVIDFEDPDAPDQTLEFGWRNTSMYMLGLEYAPAPMARVRAGYFYDQTPVTQTHMRPELPDSNRHGFSLGGGLTFLDGQIAVDGAVMYLYNETANKDNREGFDSPGGPATANGDYDAQAIIATLSASYRF